ncbi:hypothetical protein BO71DRAFT_486738 [Aspergillus ellipticus CBS 707.79]|uniref:Steroid 5-alpha reductase C-terminal domain-containing protein n=1 Tax=Aspergillus ellipticus CBS 707.79 TaxID=1448320 RepID=A0A319D1E9_9EURO|nr:hypothetical protein BO71DRAFT_486738 [Aspergillus ellipticus CBS 707.79]
MQCCMSVSPKALHDNVSRRKNRSLAGRAIFVGIRALDVWWQHHFLTRGLASETIKQLGGQSIPTNQILSSSSSSSSSSTTTITTLQPYYTLITLLSLGSSLKQIATMLLVSEQETPITSAITIAFFNTLFNSINTLRSRTAFKKDPANKGKPYGDGLFSLATNINYGGYTVWRAGCALVTGGFAVGGSDVFCFCFGIL